MPSPSSFLRGEDASRLVASYKRRERFYQCVIITLVLWNILLQGRAVASFSFGHVNIASFASGATAPPPEDFSIETFVSAEESGKELGAAGVVCSGCSTEGGEIIAEAVVVKPSKNASSGRSATSCVSVFKVNLPMPSSFPGTNNRPFKAMRAMTSKVPPRPITFAANHDST